MKTIHRILLVDDHAIVRKAIRRLFDGETGLRICGEAATRDQLLRALRTLHPDLVLLDLDLGGEGGVELLREVRSRSPDVFILVLSMHQESLFAEDALRAGANGYVMKADAPSLLLAAVRAVLAGDVYASPEVQQLIFNRLRGIELEQEGGEAPPKTASRKSKPRQRRVKVRN